MLGIEVEKLNDEELARVKAKKFAGGLRITGSNNNVPLRDPLQTGDLLVGLHVWPTTSLKDIGSVLTRGDLDELSPLKFYVIR